MSRKIPFCALMTVLGVLSVLAANIITTNTIFLFLLSTLFTYISTEEYGIKYGLLTYVAITLISFFVYTNKISIGIYAIVVGYYPVIKHIVEHFDVSVALKWFVKVSTVLILSLIVFFVFRQLVSFELPPILIFIAGIVIFVLYDIFLTIGIKFYALKLRKFR